MTVMAGTPSIETHPAPTANSGNGTPLFDTEHRNSEPSGTPTKETYIIGMVYLYPTLLIQRRVFFIAGKGSIHGLWS